MDDISKVIGSLQNQVNTQGSEKSPEKIEKRPLNDSEIRIVLEGIGVPLRYIEARKEDMDIPTWTKTEDYRTGLKDGLFLHGAAGRGKTHIAVALIRARVASKYQVRIDASDSEARCIDTGMMFVSLLDLLLEIKACFREGSEISEEGIITKYSSIPFLTLDDLGAEKSSEWVIQTLNTIIDRRYRDLKKTVITSNLTLDEIATKIGDRIASRIIGMCKIIELKGKDRRIYK